MQSKDLNCYVISGLLETYLFPDSKIKWFDRISYNRLLQSCYSIEGNILLSHLRKWLRIIPLTGKCGDDWLRASALCPYRYAVWYRISVACILSSWKTTSSSPLLLLLGTSMQLEGVTFMYLHLNSKG